MQTVYWLVIFIVLLIIEIINHGPDHDLVRPATLAAFLAGVFGFGTAVQVGVFLVVSIILLILTRPVAVKYFNKDRTKTNAESLIGQHGLVLEDVDTLKSTGRVEVNGQEWSAKTDEPDGYIGKNTVVVIDGIQGVKLIVREKEEKK